MQDLAARNVLVSDSDRCKITDFGLSRRVEGTGEYVTKVGAVDFWSVEYTSSMLYHYTCRHACTHTRTHTYTHVHAYTLYMCYGLIACIYNTTLVYLKSVLSFVWPFTLNSLVLYWHWFLAVWSTSGGKACTEVDCA